MNSFRRQRRFTKMVSRRGQRRRMLAETLESRQLMAADLVPHHNYAIATDVNGDFKVTPLDALQVINQLNRTGVQTLNAQSQISGFLDVNADGQLSPGDALSVINRLNNGPAGEGELAQVLLDVTQGGTSILDANRQFNVDVGEDFDLEVKWIDERSPVTNRQGCLLFTRTSWLRTPTSSFRSLVKAKCLCSPKRLMAASCVCRRTAAQRT